MMMGHLKNILVWVLLSNCLLTGTASAGFFGFGADDKGKSGLDFNRYDLNTVVTVSGRVTSLPHEGDRGQFLLEIRTGSESVNVSLGPESYWEKKGIQVRLNDEVSAKGAKAQGKDGKAYLLTQKLVNRTAGGQLELRSEKGNPAWSGRGVGERSSAGMMFHGGGMMRGGGGMMRH